MYIYNKDTDHLIEYIPVISEQGKIINFTVKIYDINCNFITKKIIKVRTLIHEQSNISRTPCA